MAKRRRETIHLGVLYSLTGPYGLVGREMLNGLTLAVEQVNTSAEFDFQFAPLVFDPGGDLACGDRAGRLERREVTHRCPEEPAVEGEH